MSDPEITNEQVKKPKGKLKLKLKNEQVKKPKGKLNLSLTESPNTKKADDVPVEASAEPIIEQQAENVPPQVIGQVFPKLSEHELKEKINLPVKKTKRKLKLKLAPISSICSILLGGVIALISTFSFIVNILTTQNPIALLIDIFVMTLSYLTVWQGIYYSILDRIAKERMEEQWDYRIQPILNLLTETSGRIDSIENEMFRTNHKLKTTLDYFMRSEDMDASKAFILPGVSFKFISKILVLIFFTFSALVYVSSYPLGIVHYFILVIYLSWWVFITAEFKLFGNTTAWIWAIGPIMTIPAVGIIMSAVYGLNIMIGIFFLALLLYVYFYYSWASFFATGYKLIDLKPVIREIKERIEKNKKLSIKVDKLKDPKK